MSIAKKAALMAIFAAVEEREAEALTLKPIPPWERAARPIEVNLLVLERNRRKARA